MERKAKIRKEAIQNRLQMSEEEVAEKSVSIAKKVIELQEYQCADTIFCYVDFRSEVRTSKIIEQAWVDQKRVAVPKVEGSVMRFYEIHSWSDLKSGYMKILEPSETCGEILAESGKCIMVMPGVAFDDDLNRIGYGGGYYDKYLAEKEDIKKIAIAFEIQICQDLPCEEHDLRPDIIVTEKRILTGK